MSDDELAKHLQQLAEKIPELEAIFTAHPFLRRKTLDAIVLAKGDLTRALEIVMELCEQDKQFDRITISIALERFLTTWNEGGEEQH